ncbi:MAG: penicillin-binding protein [Bacteroidetes bacterium]|nr:penicillin-binding protein [Bacteroidota bacterium]MCH8231891.1 penicillin-binding protein [Bacteroidota bacterium]
MGANTNNTNNRTSRKTIIGIWLILFVLFLSGPLYIYTVSIDLWGMFGGMPGIKQLENPENDLSSELYFADGSLISRYYRYNRSPVSFDKLSPHLVNTLLISEDHRFYKHSGLDFIAYLRVFKGLVTFSYAGGGSTLTQQLGKNLYNTMGGELEGRISKWSRNLGKPGFYIRRLIAKTKEWIISVKLEQTFTKEEIIALYLNTVEFSSNSYGIRSASETYFGKEPASLNVQESAVLVGLLQAPTTFNPKLNYDNSFRKRNQVLYKLYKRDYFTKDEYDSLILLPIDLSNYKVDNLHTRPASYFRFTILWDLLKFCKENDLDLYEGGLRIYTTIDKTLQEYAEESVLWWMDSLQTIFLDEWEGKNPWVDENNREIRGFIKQVTKRTKQYKALVTRYGDGHDSVDIVMNIPRPMTVFSWDGEIDTVMSSMDSIRYYKKFLQAGFMAMDPHSGHILAWVGGINHKYFEFDHVKQGRNQPGSTFKPIVYATAIENGYHPCFVLEDVRKTYQTFSNPPTWTPRNADGKYSGEKMTIRKAMAQSKNSITAQIIYEVGPRNVIAKARMLGIESPLSPVLSLALGVSDVSVYELVGAYSAFVNQGTWTKPHYITRIEDKYGNVIKNFVPERKEALSEEDAYIMLYMLRGTVEEEGGTARGLARWDLLGENNEIGAKTGTTQNYSDGWFIGVTKDLVAGVWVGGDDRAIHFPSIRWGQGARMAMPIWADFMTKVYTDTTLNYTRGPFPTPRRRLSIQLDCSQYGLVDEIDSLTLKKLDSLQQIDESDIF